MDNPLTGRVIQRARTLVDDFQNARQRQQMLKLGKTLQRRTIDILHHDITGLRPGNRTVNGDDMRMRKFSGKRGFGDEQLAIAVTVLVIAQRLGVNRLYGNLTILEGVVGLVDHAGRAATQFLDDFAFADPARFS